MNGSKSVSLFWIPWIRNANILAKTCGNVNVVLIAGEEHLVCRFVVRVHMGRLLGESRIRLDF